jgi:hypothetical protein
VNHESTTDLQEKLLASDLFGNPRHTLWIKRLRSLSEEFESDCIFWNGDGGGELLRHRPDLEYPKTHITRIPQMQGMYHQNMINFVKQPILSPYYTPSIWEDVFKHYDPDMMTDGIDLRPEIGERLTGGTVWWPETNPSPEPYDYDLNVDPVELFFSGLFKDGSIKELDYPD